jgi:hypothetical protein
VLIANDGDVVILGPAEQVKPEHPIEGQGTIQIMDPNADVIHTLDGDRLPHH